MGASHAAQSMHHLILRRNMFPVQCGHALPGPFRNPNRRFSSALRRTRPGEAVVCKLLELAKKSRNSNACVVGIRLAIRWRASWGQRKMESLIVTLIVGAIAGWLAARVLKRTGFGLIGDIIVGVIGGYIGTWLWDVLHLPPIGGPVIVSAIITSTVGAIVLLVLLRLLRS